MNMNNEIEMSADEWEKFYENQGSQYFQLESKILQAHGDDQKKLLYKILSSTTQLIQVIGVVAGFGFTALGFVENQTFFILGEAFLFAAILVGLLWTQKIYRSNITASSKEVARIKSVFSDRYLVLKNIYDKALSDIESGESIKVSASSMKELLKKNNDLMKSFSTQEVRSDDWDPLAILMILFIFGGGSLLLSFTQFCIFW